MQQILKKDESFEEIKTKHDLLCTYGDLLKNCLKYQNGYVSKSSIVYFIRNSILEKFGPVLISFLLLSLYS